MGKKNYPEPNFYIISDKVHYTIRGEVELEEMIDGGCLQKAVDTAFIRYPYFSVQLVVKGDSWNLDPNPRPHNILHTPDKITLGTEDVNYHLVVISYYENRVFFNVSHSITDGAGRAPLTKSVLYYYLTYRYPDRKLDPEGIYLTTEEAFEDERILPVPEGGIMDMDPSWFKKTGKAFKLSEKQVVKDHEQTEYRFRMEEKEFMKFNKSVDASPSILVSALLAEMAWKMHPEIEEDIVINLCMNMRPGLKNKHSHLPLFTTIPLTCPSNMKDFELGKICTCMRGMVLLQSQDENVEYIFEKTQEEMKELHSIPSMKERQELLSQAVFQEGGILSSTFISSYVGRVNLGSLTPYIKAMYTTVDAIPEGGAIVEITTAGGYFYFTFMQDFSTDAYVTEFSKLFEKHGVTVEMLGSGPILAPDIQLPQI